MALPFIIDGFLGIFGIRTGEQPDYSVEKEDGGFELRRYHSYLTATVEVEGSFNRASEEGFHILADYIFGKNQGAAKMDMVSPVFQQPGTGESMPMPRPVFQQRKATGWAMHFVLPEKYEMSTLPRPLDPRIRIDEVPAGMVAALRYTGKVTPDLIREKTEDLLVWIQQTGFHTTQAPWSAQYDPPFAIPFLKRNEVLAAVEIV